MTLLFVLSQLCLFTLHEFVSAGYYWQECIWCASTLLHIMDLVCNFDCYQNCFHLQVSNCQCTKDGRYLWTPTAQIYHLIFLHHFHDSSCCSSRC
jgi:hypothetical protein